MILLKSKICLQSRPQVLLLVGQISRRYLHQSLIQLSKQQKPLILPYLKDKTPLIKKFQKNVQIPFNTLRDVLDIQHYDRDDIDIVYHFWLSFMSMEDLDYLRSTLSSQANSVLFWKKSIKLAMSVPAISGRMIKLWDDFDIRREFNIPVDLPETIIAAYMYHGKYSNASFIVDNYIIPSAHHIDWKPILRVGLAQDNINGVKFIASIYQKFPEKVYYEEIISTLKELQLNETYLHSWNNILISNGDYPKLSSEPMDPIIKGMIQYNLRSLHNCLKHISKLSLPDKWLSNSTSKLLALYICKQKDNQMKSLQSVLAILKNQQFGYDFWGILHKKSSMNPDFLDKLSLKYGISGASSRILKSKAGRIIKDKPREFYKYLESTVGDSSLPHLLIEAMIVSIRTSNNLPRSLELAKSLLLNSKSKSRRNYIVNQFVYECTKKIKQNRLHHHVKNIDRLEFFLDDHGFKTNETENSLVLFDIEMLRFNSATSRLKELLKEPGNNISAHVIDSIVKVMLSNESLLLKRNVFDSDDIGYNVLYLALDCQTHCSEFNAHTWETIFKYVLTHFKYQESSGFILKIVDFIQSQQHIRLDPGNPNNLLRKIFSNALLTDIIEKGFLRSKNDRWYGYKIIKELEAKGVYAPDAVVRDKLTKLIAIFHKLSTDKSKKYRNVMKAPLPGYDVQTTLDYLNSL